MLILVEQKDFYFSNSRSHVRSQCGIFRAESSKRIYFPPNLNCSRIIIPTLLHIYSTSRDRWRMGTFMTAVPKEIFSPLEKSNPSKLENSFQGCTTGQTFLHRYYSFLTDLSAEGIYSSTFSILIILFQLQVLICFECQIS